MGIDWLVISWLLNALITLALVLGCLILVVGVLATGRFFYWANIKTLVSGRLPRLTEIKGVLRLMGQELSGKAKLDLTRDEQIDALQDQVDELVRQLRIHEAMIEEITILVSGSEDRND